MYISLSDAKKHLNIDTSFTDDDTYINSLINVAELAVEKHLNIALSELKDEGTNLVPSPIIQAMLLLIGNLYANREPVAFTSVNKVPYAFEYLLSLYRNYNEVYINGYVE
jgi:hypothetical protein